MDLDYPWLWRWEPFDPAKVVEVMHGCDVPWWVAGGWALDLFLGSETRPHADLDIAMLRRDQAALRDHLKEWDLRYATPDHRLEPWQQGRLLKLPLHAIWARRTPEAPWLCEFLLSDEAEGCWVFGGSPSVRLPLAEVGQPATSGLPILAPEIVLLFKADDPKPKDEADFEAVVPRLSPLRREWLANAIQHCHPGHRWIPRLSADRSF